MTAIAKRTKSETSGDTLVPVPSDLHAAEEEAAAEEHRAPNDLVGEAIKRYLAERRWFRKDDVHAKIAAGLESLRRGEGLDGEAVMAEMLAALDVSEDEREVTRYTLSLRAKLSHWPRRAPPRSIRIERN